MIHQHNHWAQVRLIAAAGLAFLVSACGSGGSTPESLATLSDATRIVQGGFTKNAVVGADIAAYPVDDTGMQDGPAVATATTDDQGRFTLQLPVGSGMLLLETSGGEFIDEADQEPVLAAKRRIQLAPGEGLQSILPDGASEVAISIPGHALLEKARREAAGSNFQAVYTANRALATLAFGFDIATVLPADTINPDSGAALAQRQFAMLLGGFANALNRVSVVVGSPEPNIAIIDAVITDFSDGRLDGLVAGVPVMVTINQAPVAIPTDLVLDEEITRFRNNNFDAYMSTGLVDVDESTLSQTVVPNNPPIALDDSYTVSEGASLTVAAPGVLDNDSDVDNNPLSVTLDSGPVNGLLTLNPDGSFVYSHDGSETNSDAFSYSVDDSQGGTAFATVSISITPVNDAPIAAGDSFDVAEGGNLDIQAPGLLVNDTDAENDTLTAAVDTPPQNGQLDLADDGSFSYTHDGSETLSDSFIYSVSDGQGGSATALVDITVLPLNDPPIAAGDSYNVDEGATLTVQTPGVLDNDTDAENDTLTVLAEMQPTNGQLSLAVDGSFSYTHDGGETTSDSFTYSVSDGNGSAIGAVTLSINPVNDDPVAVADSYTVATVGGTLVSDPGVLANDTDPENDVLSAALDTPPLNGQLDLGTDGIFTYIHNGSQFLSDSFSYIASDGNGGAATATVSLTILSVSADSDGDGLLDSVEQTIGTDPNNPDSDNDGATDFEEVNIDGDPSSANVTPGGDTDPLNPDTDNDDVGDGIELEFLTDAHVPDMVLHVNAVGGNDSSNGFIWEEAIQTNNAVNAFLAQFPDLTYVLYSAGTYEPLSLLNPAAPEFNLVGSVSPSIYLPVFPPTTVFDAVNDGTVLVLENAVASVSNIAVVNGSNFTGQAGGIDIRGNSFVILDRVVVRENFSTESAGGVFIDQFSFVDILDSLIASNMSSGFGSGVLVLGSLVLEETVLANNSSDLGGAIDFVQAPGNFADLTGNAFLSNSGFSGAAVNIFSNGNGTVMDDNLFVGNYAQTIGGAINALSPGDRLAVDMELNTIAYNQADDGAGGYVGFNGCDNFFQPKRFAGNIFYFNDDASVGFTDIDDNVFVEEGFGAVCGPDARAAFEELVISAGDTLVDFESVATGTNLTTQIPGVTFASISDVAGNPAGPFHVEVSAAFSGSDGNTIVGAPCGGCVDDGRVRYEIVFDTPQRRAGLQRIWNAFTVTRFFDPQGGLLREFAGGDVNGGDYQFVGYVSPSPVQSAWVKRIEIDGELSGNSRQVGYTDDLFYGSADADADFGLGENLLAEFNLVQGGPVSPTGLAADPLFVSGFYLNQASSPAVNAYTGIDAAQLFSDGETTDPLGTPDTGILDLGYHYLQGAQAQPDGVGPDVMVDLYEGGEVDVEFFLQVGRTNLLEPAQLVGVCIGAGTTMPNPAISSLTTLDPVAGCNSVLARDFGDGRYVVRASGEGFASGDIILDVYVNGAPTPVSMTVSFMGSP